MTTTRRASTTRTSRPATPRIAFLPYGVSESLNSLAVTIGTDFVTDEVNAKVVKLKLTGSRYRGVATDLLINWGSRNQEVFDRRGDARVLNTVQAVTNAASKRRAFDLMREAGVSAVESTRDHEVARQWFNEGMPVFARDEDSGHSGAGIRVMSRDPIPAGRGETRESVQVSNEFSNAPLYTKGAFIGQQHREYRVHVFQGKVVFLQQKKRRDGWEQMDSYSNIVRNFHTGWVYANSSVTPINAAAVYHAVKAVEALGLDFGAVDVMTRGDSAYVLEVNTAPGLEGTTLATYADVFKKYFNNEAITTEYTVSAVDPMIAVREREAARAASESAAPVQVITRNFVKVVVNGAEESVGYYDPALNAYILAGFDVPMEPTDVVVIADSI